MQTAILLGLVYAFAWSMDNIAGSSFMDRPIVCGALTGLVMGNFEQGLVIGGTLELVWMGFISYAGIINGETRIGAILGTYFALATGNSFDVAISIAMPIAILGGNVSNAYNIVVSYLMHRWADKWAEEGNYKKIGVSPRCRFCKAVLHDSHCLSYRSSGNRGDYVTDQCHS